VLFDLYRLLYNLYVLFLVAEVSGAAAEAVPRHVILVPPLGQTVVLLTLGLVIG